MSCKRKSTEQKTIYLSKKVKFDKSVKDPIHITYRDQSTRLSLIANHLKNLQDLSKDDTKDKCFIEVFDNIQEAKHLMRKKVPFDEYDLFFESHIHILIEKLFEDEVVDFLLNVE